MQSHRYRRAGITIVELLVVISIVAVLAALIFPAIQMVRASASRTSCGNNVRQIGLAVHSFESSFGRLPEGIKAYDAKHFPSITWLTQILPLIERNQIWDQAIRDFEVLPSPFSHEGLKTRVSVFNCPSDSRTRNVQSTHQGRIVAHTSYLGVNGTDYRTKNGVFYLESQTTFRDVSDGLSNTLLIGERPPSSDFWYGWWYAGFGQLGSGSPDMLLGTSELNEHNTYLSVCEPGPFQFDNGSSDSQCSTLHFWSHHSGGAHFSRVDASTSFVTYSVDQALLNQLATRAGHEVIVQ